MDAGTVVEPKRVEMDHLGCKVVVSEVVDPGEAEAAKSYWMQPGTQGQRYREVRHYVCAIGAVIDQLRLRRVFEFGCGSGRNLAALRDICSPVPDQLTGIDINPSSLATGREEFGLDLHEGDESALGRFETGSVDLAFTVSVLDHLPHADAVLHEIGRLSTRYCLFIEPYVEGAGKTSRLEKVERPAETGPDSSAPYTYVHDYPALFAEAGWDVVLDKAMPTHAIRSGPLYRLWVVATEPLAPDEREALRSRLTDAIDHATVMRLLANEKAGVRNLYAERAAAKDAHRQHAAALAEAKGGRDAIAAELATLKEKMAGAEADRDALLLELGTLKTRMAGVEAERSALASAVKEANELRARLSDELDTVRDERDALGETLKKQKKQHIVQLRGVEDRLKGQLAYRLGRVVIDYGKSPLTWIQLPWRLRQELLRYRADAAVASLVGGTAAKSKPQAESSPGPLLEAFRQDGSQGVIRMLRTDRPHASDREMALALLQVGKAMALAGAPEAEAPLAAEAAALDQSPGTLRGLFWAAQRAGDFSTAAQAIAKLEEAVAAAPNKKEQELLEKIRRQPSRRLLVLDRVPEVKPYAIAPVASRVCYILHNSLPYSSGGYATRAHGIAQGLTRNGYDVMVVTRPGFPVEVKPELDPSSIPEADEIDGIRYLRIAEPRRTNTPGVEYLTRSADALEALFMSLRPEIVVAASNHITGLPALIAARRLGIPFIYEIRGLWEITRMSRQPEFAADPSFVVQSMMEAALAKQSERVFTLTAPMREEMAERGVDPDRVVLLPNSCDPETFQPMERDEALRTQLGIPAGVTVIGYIGTFVDYEGLEDLAEACGLLKRRGREFRLLMVGNENTSGQDRGPITGMIEQYAAQGQFSDWLIMPGRVPHETVRSYYSLIDVAPFPRKPWPVCEMVSPMKPLEALAMEKAVLVSSVRALSEMIQDGETGLVFEKGSVESLADRLEELIADPALRERLGRTGRTWVRQERTWTSTGKIMAEVLTAVVREHQARAMTPVQ